MKMNYLPAFSLMGLAFVAVIFLPADCPTVLASSNRYAHPTVPQKTAGHLSIPVENIPAPEKKPLCPPPNDQLFTLGRYLFYDKNLSINNEISCASCHKQEFSFAGGMQFNPGLNGVPTYRNTPQLNNIPLLDGDGPDNPSLFWDGREHNLEKLVLQPISHEDEMGKDLNFLPEKLYGLEYYDPLFHAAFGTSQITLDRIAAALAEFVKGLATYNTKYDVAKPSGFASFSASELNGLNLFENHCGPCHVPPHFGVAYPVNNGLDSVYEDPGLGGWTGNTWDIGKFKAPSLRNSIVTAPYMHDGSLGSLEEVLDFYSDGVQPHQNSNFALIAEPGFDGFHFSEQEKSDIIAFLHTLTDKPLLTDEKYSDPFETVSTADYVFEERIIVYPNPFTESAIVQLEKNAGETYQLRLTTLAGKVLKTTEIRDGILEIKKADMPKAGVYLLEIRKGDLRKTERIVLQ
ncbi:MAG: T9SS type A sorting domain-containing protein [Lewinellaceae bacterium]|nr:T9SS type A sorting domain-containing protein [Saprospiraceae bacterium]MCB9341594.1 T9SS type A sorting domain-containing protein [Lewinellaceae bacterium]